MSTQTHWRQCINCQALFFTGAPDPSGAPGPDLGDCPATPGSGHVPNGGTRLLAIRNESRPGAQDGWRRCVKCQGLYYGLNPTSVCPEDGGPHVDDGGSETYAAGTGGLRGAQPAWRWCNKCQGIWLAASLGVTTGGRCPADSGTHDATGSGEYSFAFEQDPVGPLRVTAQASFTSGSLPVLFAVLLLVRVSDGTGNAVRNLGPGNFQALMMDGTRIAVNKVTEVLNADGLYRLEIARQVPSGANESYWVRVLRDWMNEELTPALLVVPA